MLRASILPILILLVLAPSALAVPADRTVLVDRPSGNGPLLYDGNSDTYADVHALSADGCKVVYVSGADDLLPTDDDTAENVFVQDRCAPGPPVQVNRSAAGAPAETWSWADNPSISANGRFVAFVSDAENLHPDARGADQYVFVKDLTTGSVELASRGTGESGAPVAYPEFPIISGDGSAVAFAANGVVDALGDQDGVEGETNVYLRSLAFDLTRMVSLNKDGARGSGVVVEDNSLDIDHSGSNVVFVSSNRLTAADVDNDTDVYLRRAIGTLGQATELVSISTGQTSTGADGGSEAAISGDGSRVAYTNRGVFVTTCTPCKPSVRVDKAKPGGTNDGDHTYPFFADSGPVAPTNVFWSSQDALDPADRNEHEDVYGAPITGTEAARSLTGGVADADVYGASATEDMSVVVYGSEDATTLPGSDSDTEQAYVRTGGQVRNVLELAGVQPRARDAASGELWELHALSDDGRRVAFTSYARGLGSPLVDGDRAPMAYVRDVATGATTMVSVAPDGSPANRGASGPSVDAAGRRVAFVTGATNLAGGTDGDYHVYVRDLAAGTTTLVDRGPGGKPSDGGAAWPQISGDGRSVVYESASKDLPGGNGTVAHIYRTDLATGATVMIDRSGTGSAGDKNARSADVSYDGNRVAFVSWATNLGGPADSKDDVYVRDVAAGTTTWASVPQGTPAVRPAADDPSLSGDGTRVAFRVDGAGFGYGALDNQDRVFVRDLAARRTTLASPGGTEVADDSAPSFSRDGTKLAFLREGRDGLRPFVRDLATGALTRADRRDGGALPRLGAAAASLDADGSCIAFSSWSDDVVAPSPGPDYRHVYLHATGAGCPPAAAAPSGTGADSVAPVISAARVTNRRFALARRGTARAARVKRGTAFAFRLSEPARTTIAIARKRCTTKARRKRCRYVRVATLTRAGTVQGGNRVAFSGRVGRTRLARARYRATLVATDGAGNRSRPARVAFTVVRPR